MKLEIGAGIQFGPGRIVYDKELHHYAYSGAVVDDAAHVIDIAQRGQTLVVEAATSLIEEENTNVNGTFTVFTAQLLNGCKLKCEILQYNQSGTPVKTFAEPMEDAENVDSVMSALQESKGGVTQKRITVLCVRLEQFAVAAGSKMARETANRKYKDICEAVDACVQLNRGVVHQFTGGEFIITFNAAFPTAGHTYRAGICAAQIQADLSDLEIGTVVCGFDSGVAICGPMPGFTSGQQKNKDPADASKSKSKATHQAIVGTVVQNAIHLAQLCSKHAATNANISCLTTSKKHQDLSTALYFQYIDVISNIDAAFDPELAMTASKPMGLLAVFGMKSTDEADCDEWLYELQNQNAGDPFSKINECFEALLSGNREKAQAGGSVSDEQSCSFTRAEKIITFATIDEYICTENPLMPGGVFGSVGGGTSAAPRRLSSKALKRNSNAK
jgi:class 3 adenylate cyclase